MGGLASIFTGLFGGGTKQSYTPPAALPSAPKSGTQAQAVDTTRPASASANRGLASTILTSAQGVQPSGGIALKSLLGE